MSTATLGMSIEKVTPLAPGVDFGMRIVIFN